MWKSLFVLVPCVWCVGAASGNQVEFRGFVGQKAATRLDEQVPGLRFCLCGAFR